MAKKTQSQTCNNCKFLRKGIIRHCVVDDETIKGYGTLQHPCNRYPRNSMRFPGEPACGEWKELKS